MQKSKLPNLDFWIIGQQSFGAEEGSRLTLRLAFRLWRSESGRPEAENQKPRR
jgi:hypothetical protein